MAADSSNQSLSGRAHPSRDDMTDWKNPGPEPELRGLHNFTSIRHLSSVDNNQVICL